MESIYDLLHEKVNGGPGRDARVSSFSEEPSGPRAISRCDLVPIVQEALEIFLDRLEIGFGLRWRAELAQPTHGV